MSWRAFASSIALVAFALAAGVAQAQSMPSCQFATGGDGTALTIAVRGSPRLALDVDWGDGHTSVLQRELTANRGRAFVRHEYAAPGTYTVRARLLRPDGGGCTQEILATVPYQTSEADQAQGILPPPGRAETSDVLGDVELGEGLAEAHVEPPPRQLSVLERAGAAVRAVLSDAFGRLFGR